jgi:hypothetical protein
LRGSVLIVVQIATVDAFAELHKRIEPGRSPRKFRLPALGHG